MAKTAQQMVEKYTRGMAEGGKAYIDGIASTDKDPIQLAIAAAPKYEARVMEAIRENRYAEGLAGTNKQQWQQASKAGAQKFTQSATTAGAKFQRYATVAAPLLAQISQEVQAMPNITEADAEARMIENMRKMKQLKGITRGRGR